MKKKLFNPQLLLVGIILIAGYLRLYNIKNSVSFSGDPANDLIIARLIVESGHRPLVGPLLSIQNIYLPPTYYYFLAFCWLITRSIYGVTTIFILLNIISLFIIYKLTSRLWDQKMGLIAAFLFATSSQMLGHARNMWQPHPVQFFLILSLYLLILSENIKKVFYLFLAILSFVISCSIYPAPILLSPYFFVHGIYFFKNIKKQKLCKSIFYTLGIFTVFGIIVYLPQIYFETQEHYPTWYTVSSGVFGLPSINAVIIRLWENISLLITDFFNPIWITTSNVNHTIFSIFIIFFIFLLIYLISLDNSNEVKKYLNKVKIFFQPTWLAVGLILMTVYQLPNFSHRTWAFYPFIFILMALIVRYAFVTRNFYYKGAAIILIFYYLLGNGLLIKNWVFNKNVNLLNYYRQTASYISKDMQANNLESQIVHYQPDDYENYNFPSVLFFLVNNINYPIKLTVPGNDLARIAMNTIDAPNVYIICENYQNYMQAQQDCVSFLKNQYENLSLVWVKMIGPTLFIFKMHDVKQKSV